MEDEVEEFDYMSTCDVSTDDLELIKLVRSNPGLWNNSLKIYTKVEEKCLAWSMIGQNLSIPLSGPDAQKKFSNMRSTFGRLYKKALQNQPKSGSADTFVHVYVHSCVKNFLPGLFLKDAIKPRNTTSNFVILTSVPKKSENTKGGYMLDKFVLPVQEKLQNPSTENMKISKLLSSHTMSPILQQNESELLVDDPSSLQESQDFLESSTYNHSSYNLQTDVSDVNEPIPSKIEEIPLRKRIKLETPPPDGFYKKKKVKDDEDLKLLKDMTASMRTVSATLTTTNKIQKHDKSKF